MFIIIIIIIIIVTTNTEFETITMSDRALYWTVTYLQVQKQLSIEKRDSRGERTWCRSYEQSRRKKEPKWKLKIADVWEIRKFNKIKMRDEEITKSVHVCVLIRVRWRWRERRNKGAFEFDLNYFLFWIFNFNCNFPSNI